MTAAGLPFRTEVLLTRERNSFERMVGLLSSAAKGDVEPPPLSAESLIDGLASAEPARAPTAAFLIGRCVAEEPDVDADLTARLHTVLVSGPEADVRIEAAMSLGLRGAQPLAQAQLRAAALQSQEVLGNQYKAAFYLAQYGDPSGYPSLMTTSRSEIPHYRLMAVRHAVAFQPFDGRTLAGGVTIDVRGLLVERLHDPDELVRCEVPFYLEELAVPDLRDLLEPLEQQDPAELVRTAAHMALERGRRRR